MVESPDSFLTPDGEGLGGATCCPEFESLVANSLTSLDVISLGAERGLNAVQHFVVDEMQASSVSQSHPILPSAIHLPPGWKVFDTQIQCKKPHVKRRVSELIWLGKSKCDICVCQKGVHGSECHCLVPFRLLFKFQLHSN